MEAKMKKLLSVVSLLLLAANLLLAQVTYETVTTSNGFHGQGAFTSTSKISLSGDAKRSDNSFQFTGSIMKHFSPKGINTEITRLDKQLFWKFNDKDKKYQELTFAQMKEMFEKRVSDSPWPAESTEQDKQGEKDDSEYEWQEPVVAAKKLGDRQKINNFNCEHYLVTVTTVGKHKATGILDTLLFATDLWNSVNVGKAMLQITDFDKRLAEALGFSKANNQGMARLLTMYREQLEDLQKELGKIEGFPIKTDMTLSMTKHAMKTNESQPTAEKQEETSESSAPTDVKGALGGFLGKKAMKMAKPNSEKPKPTDKMEIFQAATEVRTIGVGALAADLFEVPAEYKLSKSK